MGVVKQLPRAHARVPLGLDKGSLKGLELEAFFKGFTGALREFLGRSGAMQVRRRASDAEVPRLPWSLC